jgi:hypothetical protein
MKWILLVLCFAFLASSEPAGAQQCFLAPNGVPVCYNSGYISAPPVQPAYPGPSPYPYVSGQLPPGSAPFAQFYNPVCHYTPGVWGWQQECF